MPGAPVGAPLKRTEAPTCATVWRQQAGSFSRHACRSAFLLARACLPAASARPRAALTSPCG